MLFSSITFLFYYLPIFLLSYYIVPWKYKNAILFIFSLFFYAWGEPKNVFLMLISIFICYILGILIEHNQNQPQKKLTCLIGVLISLSFLFYFKYINFFIQNINAVTNLNLSKINIVLPIGISFYTFQIISYLVDVYRGAEAQHNFISLGTYIAMFPQLIAGPIIRYSDVNKQLEKRNITIDSIGYGIERFVIGLAKKVLLANQFGEIITIYKTSNNLSIAFTILYIISLAFQIYFDFSGYSDMAIGLGKMLGFSFNENFNYPYMATSISDFWRRWHISLGNWFKDYVYIPLGGNKCKKTRWIFNLFAVWFLTGFWHGATWNFIIWGLYFCVLLIIEKQWLQSFLCKHVGISHIYVLILVLFSFVIFDNESFSMIGKTLQNLYSLNFINIESIYYYKKYFILLIIGVICSTPCIKLLYEKQSLKMKILLDYFEIIGLIVLFIIVISYLANGSYNPFLYFRF